MEKCKDRAEVHHYIAMEFAVIASHILFRYGGLILMYHSVDDNFPAATQVQEFAEQMALLRAQYKPTRLSEMCALSWNNAPGLRGAVAVTFDDGFRNNYEIALPILEQYRIPATIYITTSYIDGVIGSYPMEWGGQKALTRDQIAELGAHPLITIGSHTRTHPDLSRLPFAQLDDELRGSKLILENIIGREVKDFAYPFGKDVKGSRGLVAKYYQRAVGGRFGFITPSSDPLCLPRIGIRRGANVHEVELYLHGGFYAMRCARLVRYLLSLAKRYFL